MRDRATDYARAVVAGTTVAGRLVRQACARHLRDLETASSRGLEWDADESELVIDFFATVLCLPEEADAGEEPDEDAPPVDGQPFILSPWQEFIAGSLMGWYAVKGGRRRRRFKTAYIETAKGSGKTPLCAGLLLYRCVVDPERGGQFFTAAAVKDQARIAFADIEKMVAASPQLRDLFINTVNNLAMPSKDAFIRAISSEKRGLDGKRVSGAVIDEVHEHPTAVVVNKMRKGTKGRKNAILLEPTNSGHDRTSVCWAHHEYSRKVLEGSIEADDWFAFVCGIDPCDDCIAQGKWFPDDECPRCDSWKVEGPHWLKANPNLGVSLSWQYVRDLVRQALGMPSEVGDLLRFTFCVWTHGENRAFDMGRWAVCGREFPSDEELRKWPCYGGLDMGETDDFCAWVRGWLLPDDRLAVKARFWLPSAALERFPNRPYEEWRRQGLLIVTDGDIVDFEAVRTQIAEDCLQDGVEQVGYDRRSAVETAQELAGRGIDVVPIQQGFTMDEGIRRMTGLVKEGHLLHGNNAILTWMASNAVLLKNSRNEQRWAKEKSAEKIDGITAISDLIECAIVRRERQVVEAPQMMFFGGGR